MSLLASMVAIFLAGQAPEPDWASRPPPRLPDSMFVTLDRYRYFTDCVAGRDWAIARPLFDTAIGSREESQVLDRITGGQRGTTCSYADRMSMTAMLMRGGIAESRYRHVYRDYPIEAVEPGIAEIPDGASFEWVDFGRESRRPLLHLFAGCLAERETGAVHALLLTRIGRREERAAYQALSRRFGSCLAPGQRLRANSLTLRPWLAEAQYQLLRGRSPDAE